MSDEGASRGANVMPIPPPVVFVVSFVVGIGLHLLTDDHVGGRPATTWLGALLVAGALALMGGAVTRFVRAHTTVIPHHAVTRLVTSGPYRFSRNPMYTGMTLLCVGGAFLADTWWPVATVVPAVLLIRGRVILPEEAYLRQTFGEEYDAYTRRVRRWL